MFGAQAVRMLRESWSNATMLAEELYAIFSDDVPINSNAPLTLSNPKGSQAPLTINEPGLGNQAITFRNAQGQPVGSIIITATGPALQGPPNSPPPPPPPPPSGGGAASGFIAAGPDGDGNYTITLTHGNKFGSLTSVKAAPVQSGTQGVPVSTGCIVSQNKDHTFSFMVPVWL